MIKKKKKICKVGALRLCNNSSSWGTRKFQDGAVILPHTYGYWKVFFLEFRRGWNASFSGTLTSLSLIINYRTWATSTICLYSKSPQTKKSKSAFSLIHLMVPDETQDSFWTYRHFFSEKWGTPCLCQLSLFTLKIRRYHLHKVAAGAYTVPCFGISDPDCCGNILPIREFTHAVSQQQQNQPTTRIQSRVVLIHCGSNHSD